MKWQPLAKQTSLPNRHRHTGRCWRSLKGFSTALADKLGRLSQAQWEQTARLWVGGEVVLEKTVGEVLWLFHFDLIHHRGQLTTYLRPLGSKVPSRYTESQAMQA
jgi:uncharacterized damage-inducible protein DinB